MVSDTEMGLMADELIDTVLRDTEEWPAMRRFLVLGLKPCSKE